ncbi:oxidoreductase, short chain dehydrogenase/reductase family [Luminiphilus syltensis NOR5-1B]|uniref:Oxidoreductase, short chain dehydrogenase/reductase family n=1 Tax=Luminiphilus syltensis NOR5-1B TaxID=565045 RepID=B8KVJ5_9GAMM|nr:SDR family NAD(P)-dependent oxidoreductase [Luminiphilus syltensis]EED34780.1 oxidoreductase, short chain dehydrogenase/reductase family [Luminiphilus syltensis NOR5-1B]
MNTETRTTSGGRLHDKVVILTGAAGNIGSYISRSLLREGANLVMTGRNEPKLQAFVEGLVEEGFDRDNILIAIGDSAKADICREIVKATVNHFGNIDVLVNNAGGAGPRRTLRDIPFSESERLARGDDETMLDAAMNLLAGAWNMTRAAVPHMSEGGSIVNVSTIFSRTHYYGRIPYVVPKSGLNALSIGLAKELGEEHGIRVNTLFPGPIESERIDTVFGNMDALQSAPAGATSQEFRDLMITRRENPDGEYEYRYPTPNDVASTVTWLASEESAALSGHHIEVTNGMQVPAQSRSKLVSWPDKRLEDLSGQVVFLLAGSDYEDALAFAERHMVSGAKVVLAFRSLESLGLARSLCASRDLESIHLLHLEPLRRESADRCFDYIRDHFGRLDGIVVLPRSGNGEHGYSLSTAGDDDVEAFVRDEIISPVAFAAALAINLDRWGILEEAPALTYVTNPTDGHGDYLNEVKRAAIEALIRIWRHEDRQMRKKGEREWAMLPNQLVRYDNNEEDNLTFTADWAATLTNRVRRMDPINLWVPESIMRATGKSGMPQSIQRVLPGLHKGRTAVITGGSLGIGLQLGRFLAIAGARVLLSARSKEKLEEARHEIVEELRGVGYPNAHQRVHILPDIDVGDEEALERLYNHSIELFGNVDFLINNAGISGAEEMVVDMSLEAWNRTMYANLISNYSLIRKYAPKMKANGYGVVLNVSSYFGGEKYVAVAYPNRADYAVSKAGQRVLAEILSRHLGPEIRINALAPGPVDGARLRGLGGAPGLFERRGRLVLENKRLNSVHKAVLAALREGATPEVIMALSRNALGDAKPTAGQSKALDKLFAQVEDSPEGGNSTAFLLNRDLAEKLMNRLVTGGLFTPESATQFMEGFVDAPAIFFDEKSVNKAAAGIEAGILNRLHLHKMPTDEQIGLSTVFHLADDIASGETFHPSGGLKFDRSVTEGELLLPPDRDSLAKLKGKRVVLIGDSMREELSAIGNGFINQGVASLTVLTRSPEACEEVQHSLQKSNSVTLDVRCIEDNIEDALDDLLQNQGGFDVVVSAPFSRLPYNPLAAEREGSWNRVLSHTDFARLIDEQLTHHFRVARRAALVPNCQIVLLTPDTSFVSSREEFALALFVKNSLHAFTVTLGVETERLPTVPAVNQVQLTRRARAEEPATESELQEEMERLVSAVLQCAVPAPSPSESRYLARIFRGNAVTV